MSRIVVYVADHDELVVREAIEAALHRDVLVPYEVTVESDSTKPKRTAPDPDDWPTQ